MVGLRSGRRLRAKKTLFNYIFRILGGSITFMGIIGGSLLKLHYQTYDRTNTETVKKFFKYILKKIRKLHKLEDVIVILDNHSAHKAHKTRSYLKSTGV